MKLFENLPGPEAKGPKPDLLRRRDATTATLRKWQDRPFSWRHGFTCLHMTRGHMIKMGHRPEPLPRVRSLVAARRALKLRGWKDCAEMIDAQGLSRISPARMLPGDLAFRKGDGADDDMGGLAVCTGAGAFLGWYGNAEAGGLAVVMITDLDQFEVAWRL